MNAFSPISEAVLTAVLAVYQQTSNITLGLMGMILSVRVAFLVSQFASASCYGELFQELIAYLGISNLFPLLIRLILNSINGIVSRLSYSSTSKPFGSSLDVLTKLFINSQYFEVIMGIGDIFIGAISKSAYSVVLAVFVAIAPVVFLVGLTFGMKGKIIMYFSTFIAIALWPVLWNLLGLLGNKLSSSMGSSQIASMSFAVVIYFLQLLSPLFSILLFTTLNPAGALKRSASMVRLK